MVDVEPYLSAWRERWAREARDAARLRSEARELAHALADTLKREFGVRRVWLIGSLARGEFVAGSDIDLVAEGIPPARLFTACARLQAAAQDIDVDLAPLEDLRPRARRALAREGIEL